MPKINIFIIAIILVIALVFLLSFEADSNSDNDFCLLDSYYYYKKNFMTNDGRIMDPDRGNITTSEGQSYIMLRSLVAEDKDTFNLAYKWTKNNLQREDKLFAWLWGEDSNGKYRILDNNSASDADVDIAFALVLAYEKWGKYKYLLEAMPIIDSIWSKETKRIGNHLILMPGVEQTNSDIIEVNPSYFSPYAFRFFQKYDNIHDWNCLIDSSYYYLNEVMSETVTGLPPNWFLIEENENGAQIVLEDSERSDFSYDAIRVFIRVYLDYLRTGEKRALPILEKAKFFIEPWQESKHFYVNYKENGELRNKDEFIGAIAILTAILTMYDAEMASEVYDKKIESYFKNKKYWQEKRDYYGKNLLWFACYLYNKNSKAYKDMQRLKIKGY